jgi:hypothetical protein
MGNSLSGVCIRPKDFAPNGSPICSDTTDIQTSVGMFSPLWNDVESEWPFSTDL